MNHVIARFRLTKRRITFDISAKGIENVPVSRVITGGEFVAAVPNNADGPGYRARGHPWEDGRLRLRAVAYPERGTPGVTFIGRVFNEDVVVIRITHVDGSISRYFYGKEQVGIAGTRSVMNRIGYWGQSRRWRNADGDRASAAADVDRAIILINSNVAGLTDCSGRGGVSVGEAAVN